MRAPVMIPVLGVIVSLGILAGDALAGAPVELETVRAKDALKFDHAETSSWPI